LVAKALREENFQNYGLEQSAVTLEQNILVTATNIQAAVWSGVGTTSNHFLK